MRKRWLRLHVIDQDAFILKRRLTDHPIGPKTRELIIITEKILFI